jgi:hypothetical protein
MRRRAVSLLGLALALAAAGGADSAFAAPLADGPVIWYEDDRRNVPKPAVRETNLLWSGIDDSFARPFGRLAHPGRLLRRAGTLLGGDHVPPAANVNALDEVPNSSWFTNRIGLFEMAPEAVAAGPHGDGGPATTGTWTIVRAKSEGVTPGFNIKDERGIVYVIKFDAPDHPGMSSAAGAITGRLFHAAGYNVPADDVVTFDRERLRLGDGVNITDLDGRRRPMTVADIDTILSRVTAEPDGRYRAIASRFLDGEPLGPFDWKGRREDDPNDAIDHEERRELRAFRVFAAWLAHYDTKQENTLDMFVTEGDRRYVKHHLIDFASTLGAGANGPFRSYSYEHSFDFPPVLGRSLALGLHEDKWRGLAIPDGLTEVGYFQADRFDPIEYKPLVPNTAFANLTDRDGYWAAKIISAFRDGHLAAAVAAGRYRNPEAAAWILEQLKARRDTIARHWFDRVTPLDFFRVEPGDDGALAGLVFADLGAERGVYPGTTPAYRARWRLVDRNRDGGAWSAWLDTGTRIPPAPLPAGADPTRFPFAAFEVQVNRGHGWSSAVTACVSLARGAVVAVDR